MGIHGDLAVQHQPQKPSASPQDHLVGDSLGRPVEPTSGAHIRFGKIYWNWENNLREKQQLLGKSIVHLIWNCSSNWKIDWTQQKLGEHGIGNHYISTAMIGFAGQLYG